MEISNTAELDFIRARIANARHAYIEDMENKLSLFEKKMAAKDFKIYWASNEQILSAMMISLMPERLQNRVCIDLAHIPDAINECKSIKKVSTLDVESFKQTASVLITEADFAVVESGTLVLLNKKSRNCFNSINNIFIILDISKLVNKMSELETILYVRSFFQSGKFMPDDIKLINRPFKHIEQNKAQYALKQREIKNVSISVFLYDKNVTSVMKNPSLRSALYCIDCGLCKTVCPIYQYTKELSPIGLVRANSNGQAGDNEKLMKSMLMCGNCDQICPAQIPLSELLHTELESAKGLTSPSSLAKTFNKRKKLNKMQKGIRRYFFLKKLYGQNKMLLNYFRHEDYGFFNTIWRAENEQND